MVAKNKTSKPPVPNIAKGARVVGIDSRFPRREGTIAAINDGYAEVRWDDGPGVCARVSYVRVDRFRNEGNGVLKVR